VSSDDQVKGIARLREGTAGEFGNIVLANIPGKAVLHADCGSETHSNAATNPDDANTLWFSSNNLIVSSNDLSTLFESCGGALSTAKVATSSGLLLLPSNLDQSSKFMDFRPGVSDSPVYQNIDAVPADGFFDTVTFKGAMDKTNWMAGWSILSEAGKLPADITGESLSGTITADKTLSASTTYLMTGQVFVKSGATLTIEAGTTIYAYGDDGNGAAPALVIEQGAKIMAAGTASNPITFTSAADPKALPKRGLWGGVIVLGKAPIAGGSTDSIEGLPTGDGIYGGNAADDNSGTMQYVRIWYGGSVIGQDNEINGLTLGGVGSGTTLDHIDIAYNLDDGIEFFGGTVNVKYLSVVFCGDDAIDTDQGYQGKIQFAFVIVDRDGHHGTEMDSKIGKTPRSFPQLYNALFVGSLQNDPNSVSSDDAHPAMMRLRENTGGEFGNIVMVNVKDFGVMQTDCGTEMRTHTLPATTDKPDYLWFSDNNIISGPGSFYDLRGTECTGFTAATPADPLLLVVPQIPLPTSEYDPRPRPESPVFNNVDALPSDSFWTKVDYKGAFGKDVADMWISGYTWLADNNRLAADLAVSTSETDDTLTIILGTVFGGLAVIALISCLCFYRRARAVERKYVTLIKETDQAPPV
jgi:hypothetical protein